MSPTSPELLSFDAYLAGENQRDNEAGDRRHELVDGELVAMPPESLENCLVARRLFLELAKCCPLIWLSYKEVEIEVSGQRATTRIPDLMILGEDCYTALATSPRGTITRDMPPPLLVIEVVSPGHANQVRDYRYKRSEYAARGILEYWIVDPQPRQVTVLRLVEGLYEESVYPETAAIASEVVPTLQVTPASLFSN